MEEETKEIENQSRGVLREIIFKAENEIILHFFDRMLAKNERDQTHCVQHMVVLNSDEEGLTECLQDSLRAENIINELDMVIRTALHIAAA